MKLGTYEKQLIEFRMKSSASINVFVAWENERGDIDFGPMRWGYRNNYHHADGTVEDSVSVSPFMGAWSTVPMSKIRRVRNMNVFGEGNR